MERPRRAELLALLVLGLAPAAAPAQTGEPVVVRLNDAVGDTLDLAERDSFHLFPNTAGFGHVVILALPGPEYYARITRTGADSATPIFLRILPTNLERIRFLIDHHESVAEQQRTDSAYAQALASFWHSIEDRPLRSMTSERPVAPEAPPPPTEAATAGEPPTEPVTSENRYNYALHGTALGSCAGSYIGSRTSVRYVRTEETAIFADCPGSGYFYIHTPIYSVNHPLFWTTACGITALGSTAGYMVGDKLDRKTLPAEPLTNEGRGWRTCCAIGAAIPGLTLGVGFVALAAGFHSRGGEIENDPDGLTILPMALTGLCIAVELATIGYRFGHDIDRRNAAKAEAKRRALGR